MQREMSGEVKEATGSPRPSGNVTESLSHNLRPRRHGPPSDHSYSNHIPGVPIYDLHVTPIISGLTLPSLSRTEAPVQILPILDVDNIKIELCDNDFVVEEVVIKSEPEMETDFELDVKPDIKPDMSSESSEVNTNLTDSKKCVSSAFPRKKRRKRKAFYEFGLRMQKRKRKCKPAAQGSEGQCLPLVDPGGNIKSEFSNTSLTDYSNDIGVGVAESCNDLKGSTSSNLLAVQTPSEASLNLDKENKKISKPKGVCTSCGKKWKRRQSSQGGNYKEGMCSEFDQCNYRRQSERLYIKNYKLPFEELPVECKLMVFSYLSPVERAKAGLVCQDWNQLINMPSVWSHVDLTLFNQAPTSPNKTGTPFKHITLKYTDYKERMIKYLDYLRSVQATLKSLKFKFDIGHLLDDWMYQVCSLVHNSKSQGMSRLVCDWTVTPMQPGTEHFCCIFNKIRSMFRRHQFRLGVFHRFLQELSTVTPHLTHIQCPFDWSPRSVLFLCRFKDVQVLKLSRYLDLRGLEQNVLDVLMKNLPELRQLELAICMPLFSNKTLFKLRHEKLQTLDIVHCQGFFLEEMSLPELSQFKVFRQHWRGVLATRVQNTIPCLYDLLSKGAPKLDLINKHKLPSFWTEFLYDELDHALYRVCPCKTHTFHRE